MKVSEIETQNIYSNGSYLFRKVNDIVYDENWGWVVQYVKVGCGLVRDRIHFMDKGECNIRTFAKWASHGYSEDTFIAIRRLDEAQ